MQDSNEKEENPELPTAIKQEVSLGDEPIVIEEEELHLTLKKEESLAVEQPSSFCPKEPDYRASRAGPALHTGPSPQPEWRQISEALQVKLTCEQQTEGHFIPKVPYLPHRWDQNKPAGHVALPEPSSRVKDSTETHGGRVGKVLPMCKQADRQCIDLSTDSFSEKEDYGVIKKESSQGPTQTAAYCKASQGVMSPLAKKKLLSQVCESNPFSFTSNSLQPPPPTAASSLCVISLVEQQKETRKGDEEVAGQRHGSDSVPEVAPIFRPSVIQHAQSSKPHQQVTSSSSERSAVGELSDTYSCRTSHHLQPQVNPPWQPYLPRTHAPDSVENTGEKLLQATQSRNYAGDCYSSPHLHNLYRQTENCLSQERMAGFVNGEQRENYARDHEDSQSFVCGGLEQEGLAYRSHYSDRTQTHRESRETENEPRDFTISKPLSQRVSSFSKPSFCSLAYPIMHQGLESHPKACRVPPMTISPPKQSSAESLQSFPSPKTSGDSPLTSPIRPSKRSLVEPDNDEVPERKVRVVTPIHPAASIRRSDPEELKPAEPAHAIHLNNHLPEGHPTTTFPPPHAAHLYTGMYPPGSLVTPGAQDGLQQHPGLQYLKSQSAVSPLVPPLAFHSMMFHRQLLASSSSPHHFYRHPGGAALYGDLLHHLYPLSTLPPPQLSSVHPSTRLWGGKRMINFFLSFILRLYQLLFVCHCSGIVAQSKENTLADYRLINWSVRQTENSIFFFICVCICLYTLHCSLFLSPLTVSFTLLYPYLHNAHVYVLTNQFVALNHHESGCCSGRVKSGGQQRKAICLLHLRAKLCCLKTLQVTWQLKLNSLYNWGVFAITKCRSLPHYYTLGSGSRVVYVYMSPRWKRLPVRATVNPPGLLGIDINTCCGAA